MSNFKSLPLGMVTGCIFSVFLIMYKHKLHILLLILLSLVITNLQVAEASEFKDDSGRIIKVSKPYKRIISLYGAHTENLFALGLDKEIIGVSRSENYPKKALTKRVFSYRDDPEKFLAHRPDLVLVRPMIERSYPGLISRLEKSGIKVVSLQPSNVREMYEYWNNLGILCGREDYSQKRIEKFKSSVAKIKQLVKDVPVRKRVYLEAIHSRMKTFTNDSMAAFVLKTAGGVNVASDAKQVRNTNIAEYGKERILSKADEIDVYIAQKGFMNRVNKALIKNEKGFSSIRAIKNNEVYIVNEMIVSRPTARLLKGIHTIGSILYPEVFNSKNEYLTEM